MADQGLLSNMGSPGRLLLKQICLLSWKLATHRRKDKHSDHNLGLQQAQQSQQRGHSGVTPSPVLTLLSPPQGHSVSVVVPRLTRSLILKLKGQAINYSQIIPPNTLQEGTHCP